MTGNRCAFVLLWTLFIMFSINCAFAADNAAKNTEKSWTFLGGYGVTHKGLGKTRAHVETLDAILRYEKMLFSEAGRGWYRGNHVLMFELPFSHVTTPATNPIVGLNFLGSWIFTCRANVQPYLLGGGGVVYTEAEIPGLGSNWNANWQIGLGLRHHASIGRICYEYRFHHISNTGISKPNDPLNSSKILVGIRF